MERKVFKIFGKVLVSNKPKVAFNIMNAQSMQQGIFVPEKLCYKWLFDILRETAINTNSTFYKSWNDIKSRTRWQLFLDQIRHYISTYGTDFEGQPFVMNDGETPEFPYKELKVLEGITMKELIPEIKKLGYSNIAFSSEILDFLFENKQYLEIDKIQNRNLKMMCIPDNYQFKNGQECLNWILWKFFNIEMLVKNKETFQKIQPHPAMLKIYTDTYKEAVKWMNANMEEALALGAKVQDISMEDARKLFAWSNFTDHLTDADLDALEYDVNFMVDTGMIEKHIDKKDFVNRMALK